LAGWQRLESTPTRQTDPMAQPHLAAWLVTTTAHGDATRTRDFLIRTRPHPWAARWLFAQLHPDLAPHITCVRPSRYDQ
jgi:hypothetical protein